MRSTCLVFCLALVVGLHACAGSTGGGDGGSCTESAHRSFTSTRDGGTLSADASIDCERECGGRAADLGNLGSSVTDCDVDVGDGGAVLSCGFAACD